MSQSLISSSIPLRRIGRLLFGFNLIVLIIIWLLGIYAYASLEGPVPTSFDSSGQPREYGSSEIYLLVLPIMSLAPIIILLVTVYRFTALNKYPYLINLPAFYAYITRIPYEKRGYWVNRYFEVVLAVGAFLSAYMSLLLWGIYLGSVEEAIPNWFLPLSLGMIPLMIVPLIYSFYRLSKQMKKAVKE